MTHSRRSRNTRVEQAQQAGQAQQGQYLEHEGVLGLGIKLVHQAQRGRSALGRVLRCGRA